MAAQVQLNSLSKRNDLVQEGLHHCILGRASPAIQCFRLLRWSTKSYQISRNAEQLDGTCCRKGSTLEEPAPADGGSVASDAQINKGMEGMGLLQKSRHHWLLGRASPRE